MRSAKNELFHGKKVFILDSCQVSNRAIKKELEARHCLVESATSSASALMRIIHWHPDLLITSVVVGEISGFDLCLILKLMSDYAGMPIVVISSDTRELAQRKAADAGADFYLHKDGMLVSNILKIFNKVFCPEPGTNDSKRQIRRVLIVDDSKVMRRIIANILATMGISEIVEADNGVHALDKLRQHEVDMILTDWNMPQMNGLDFTRAVRKEMRWKKIPMVMVTTEGGSAEMAAAEVAGINGHLCKPFSHEALKTLINRFVAE